MLTFLRYKRGHYLAVAAGYLVSLVLAAYSFDISDPVSATDLLVIQPGPEDGIDTMVIPMPLAPETSFYEMPEVMGGFINMDSYPVLSSSKASAFFNVSSLAPGSVVTSATVSFYDCANNSDNTPTEISVHQLTNFGAGGPEYNPVAEDSALVGSNNNRQWHDFTIPNMVQDWVDTIETPAVVINYASSANLESMRCFISKDNIAELEFAPKLTVEYQSGEPPTASEATFVATEDITFNYEGGIYSSMQMSEEFIHAGVFDIESRSFFKYDLSLLDEQDAIVNASFGLYYNGYYIVNDLPVDLSLHRVTEVWEETSTTWNDQPAYDPVVIDTVTIGDSSEVGWYYFDVTDLLQNWLDGEYQDYGFMLSYAGGENEGVRSFYSSNYTDDLSLRPKIIVEHETNSELEPVYHKGCQSGSCVDMEGTGDNECDSDTQCLAPLNPTPSHKICQNSSCVTVEGEGVDQCSLDSQCQITASDTPTPAPTLPPAIKPDPDDPPQEEEKPRDDQEPNKIFGPVTPPDDPTNLWQDFIRGLATSNLPLWTLIFAGLFSIISTAFLLWTYLSVEISFKQYFLAIINYISSIFVAKKKNKKGLVYDSSNGRGVPGAIVGLYSFPEMRLVASAFTDKKGEYYLIARSGNFAMSVTAGGFIFPSVLTRKLLVGDASQYFGETININSDSAINYKIPLDPGVAFKPNRKFIYKLVLSSNLLRLTINTLGTVLSLVALWLNPSSYNYFIATAYLFLWILEFIVENREIKFSKVVDESSGEPLDLALVRLVSEDGKLIKTSASDMVGRVLVENTNHSNHLLIERSGYKQSTFNIRKTGFVEGQKFKLQKY